MCGCISAPLSAAEISAISPVRVVLEGEIKTGDYDKLRNLIDPNSPVKVGVGGVGGDWYVDTYREIYLASPGGNVAEAMKIGRLLRALRWETIVPGVITNPNIKPEKIFKDNQLKNTKANYMCASACFFIFVAGLYRDEDVYSLADNRVILSIHRPYLTDSDLRSMTGSQAITSGNQIRFVVENYLKEMGVSMKYADLMFSIPKDEIQWIDSGNFAADFKGTMTELKDWFDALCDKRTGVEKVLWESIKDKGLTQMTAAEKSIGDMLLPKMVAKGQCEEGQREKLRKEAWSQMFQPGGKSSISSWWHRFWRSH